MPPRSSIYPVDSRSPPNSLLQQYDLFNRIYALAETHPSIKTPIKLVSTNEQSSPSIISTGIALTSPLPEENTVDGLENSQLILNNDLRLNDVGVHFWCSEQWLKAFNNGLDLICGYIFDHSTKMLCPWPKYFNAIDFFKLPKAKM